MGDTVLVTGAGTGIGLATSLHLAEKGFRVYASVPDPDQREGIDRAARERGVALSVISLDVTNPSSIESAVGTVLAETGGIFGLVNNAGLGLRGFFEDLSTEEIRSLFDVNVFGAMAVTRSVLPHMRSARRGRIVLISSAGGRNGAMTLTAYCAGKFALEGFGESLAMEVAAFGLNVSLIEPGLVMTPHFTVHRGRARRATDPEGPYYRWFVQHEQLVDEVLRARHITADDVAKAVGRSLLDRSPRLRYVVGWRARLLLALQRRLPGELFERLYSRQVVRMVTRPRKPATGLAETLGVDRQPSVPRNPHRPGAGSEAARHV